MLIASPTPATAELFHLTDDQEAAVLVAFKELG